MKNNNNRRPKNNGKFDPVPGQIEMLKRHFNSLFAPDTPKEFTEEERKAWENRLNPRSKAQPNYKTEAT